MSTEIETNVRNLLCAASVTMKSVYLGLRDKVFNDTRPMDAWIVTFHNETSKRSESFDYFTGLGHRKCPTPAREHMLKSELKNWHSSHHARMRAEYEKPVSPEPASVLHSILLDSEACNQSFSNWCSDLGYDEDSRKAYATYEACQKNADKLARVLDSKTRDALRDALQDY